MFKIPVTLLFVVSVVEVEDDVVVVDSGELHSKLTFIEMKGDLKANCFSFPVLKKIDI